MKRLLFVSPVGFIGGAERVLLECVRQVRIRKPDWSVTVLLLDEGPLTQAVVELGAKARVVAMPAFLSQRGDSRLIQRDQYDASNSVPTSANQGVDHSRGSPKVGDSKPSLAKRIFDAPMYAVELFGFYRRVKQVFRELQPDLVHSNGLKSHLITSLTRPTSAPVLWHIHDFYSHRPKVQAWIRRLSSKASGCLAISPAVADDIRMVLPGMPVHLLENAVDTERFSPGPAEANELERLASLENTFNGLRVGLIATYANWKGQDVFLKALAGIPNVRGYIIGGPIYSTGGSQWSEAELRGLAESLGITDRIGFIRFQSDPTRLYRSLDIVVHASIRPEPFGLTIIEAMACGRPVVVSDAGGASSLFIEGETGIGHIPGDVDSLRAAIVKLTDDAQLRKRMGSEARSAAKQRFSTDRFGEKLLTIFESI